MPDQENYSDALDFLFRQLPMFSHLGKAAYRADLNNIIALCATLGNPERKFPSVHVAGTNGKGSVSHMLAAVFQESGYRTGLYTSPHLKDFRERIRVNGEMADRDFVIDFIGRVRSMVSLLQPSFFEITVAMAFCFFAEKQVDIAIIETGLGGRLDSTNIIVPVLSVITNISYDHQNILGNSLQEIAGEKAGIIKPGVPVVIGEYQQEVAGIFTERAEKYASPFFFGDREFRVVSSSWYPDRLEAVVRNCGDLSCHTYLLDLNSQYQTKNLLTVLAACNILGKTFFGITDQVIGNSLTRVKKLTGLRGRWDQVSDSPAIVMDVGHNEAGIREICRQLEILDYDQLHIVLGVVRDKDISRMLGALPPAARYYFCRAAIPRALETAELASMAAGHGLQGREYASSLKAMEAARENAGSEDLILVCGSCFVVGELI